MVKKFTTAPGKVSRQGDIILGIRASIGERVWSDRPYCLGRGVAGLRPFDTLDPNYLWHWLGHSADRLRAKGRGATFLQVNRLDINEMEIPLPPLDEQQRIAAILDQADAIRTCRSKVLAQLGEVAQSLFLEVFGDPVHNPRGWPTHHLADLTESGLSNGAYFPKNSYGPDGVEMVHMSDVFYDQVERGDLKRVRASDAEIEKYCVADHDLLVARRSLNYSGAAKPCLVPQSTEPLLYESSLIKLTPNASVVRTRYLFHLLNNRAFRRGAIAKIVTGTTIFGVSQSNLSRVQVPVPPLSIQDRFTEGLNSIDEFTLRAKESASYVDALLPSLQSRAFAGQL